VSSTGLFSARVFVGQQAQPADAEYRRFRYPDPGFGIEDIPLHTQGRPPLSSVVSLVFRHAVITYNGPTSIAEGRPRAETEYVWGIATGFLLKNQPASQIVTAAHNLWSVRPANTPGIHYVEYFMTYAIAVPYHRYEQLSPWQRRNKAALRLAGGQEPTGFQTWWPNLDQLTELQVFRAVAKPDALDLALLHVPNFFVTMEPHLTHFTLPTTVHPTPHAAFPNENMRAVVLGHAKLALAQAEPSYSFQVPASGISFRDEVFDIPVQAGAEGYSGGPLCIPPEATVMGRTPIRIAIDAGMPCKHSELFSSE
jgi:hypothetical protein